jgi:hypothetical protein
LLMSVTMGSGGVHLTLCPFPLFFWDLEDEIG